MPLGKSLFAHVHNLHEIVAVDSSCERAGVVHFLGSAAILFAPCGRKARSGINALRNRAFSRH